MESENPSPAPKEEGVKAPRETWLVERWGSLYGSDGPVGDLDERDAGLVADDMNEGVRDRSRIARAVRYIRHDLHESEVSTLRAALEWRPIETADKVVWPERIVTAPPVLLCDSATGTIGVGHWEDGGGWHEGQYNTGCRLEFTPTHWMPLPAPPSKASLSAPQERADV